MDAARLKEDVQQATRTIQSKLAEGIGRVQERMEERVRRGGDQTRGTLASLNEQFGSFVQESPLIAIGGAFAVGYLIAKMARAFK
jgi:ElaB/YqjD/DUF883 family membrane-anchored ribosome-binding protein